MPTIALSAKPVRGREQQAISASEFLGATYEDSVTLQLGIQSMLDDLTFLPGAERVEAAEAAIKALGLHLGFAATRPEKEEGKGRGPTAVGV